MKRATIIVGTILLTSSMALTAQIFGGVGIKAGLSLANQSHQFTSLDYTMDTEPVAGPAVSLFLEAFKKEHLSFQLDLAYIGRGSKTTVSSITVNHLDNDRIIVNEGDLMVSRFHYLSLTPMVRLRANKGAITPYALLGPRIDLLVKYDTDSEFSLEDQNSTILGLSGGAGIEYSLDMLDVFAELHFQPDLSPVTNIEPLLINNNSLLFLVGLRF